LIRNLAETFSEIKQRAVAHISVEEVVAARNNGPQPRVAKLKEIDKAYRPLRVHETSTGKKADTRHAPYKKGKAEAKSKEDEFHPKFLILYKELINIPVVSENLRFPRKHIGIWRVERMCGASLIKDSDTTLSDEWRWVISWPRS